MSPPVRPGDWIRFRQNGSNRIGVVVKVKGETVRTGRGWVPVDRITEIRRRDQRQHEARLQGVTVTVEADRG